LYLQDADAPNTPKSGNVWLKVNGKPKLVGHARVPHNAPRQYITILQ